MRPVDKTPFPRSAIVIAVLVLVIPAGIFAAMGIFKKLFPKGAIKTEQVSTVPTHQEDWAVYLSTINSEKAGSILVDLGLRNIAPVKTRPNRVRIDITMNNPDVSGLPSEGEMDRLHLIEDAIHNAFNVKHGAIYAGHLYYNGELSLYEYVDDTESAGNTIAEAMATFPDYKFKHKVDREEAWESYSEFLYPLPINMQSIQNGRVIQNSLEAGDNLEKEREVRHWIYFKTENDKKRFLGSIKGIGFTVENISDTKIEGFSLGVILSRFDKLDPMSVDGYVLDLWQKAEDVNGDYDGWEAGIVKD